MNASVKAPRGRRRPVARHARLRQPHPLGQIAVVLATVIAVVLVSAAGTAGFALWTTTEALVENAPHLEGTRQLPPSIGEMEGGANLLIVGTDSCEGANVKLSAACSRHATGGERNDVTMLVHIGDNPRRVTVVSFPRDMLVPIPSCPSPDGGRYSAMSSAMMNASYSYGGLACTALTVKALTGMDVDFAAAIRWTGVIKLSDAIGGVKVCVSGDINDGNTRLHLKAGTHTLKGTQALQFLRIRHGIGDGSDLGRISNQQQFMSSLVRKLQGEGVLSNPGTLFNIATTAMQQVTNKQLILSDQLANPTRMVQIAMAVKDVPYKDIVFLQYPTYYAGGTPQARDVHPRTDAAAVLFKALKENKAIRLTGQASQGQGVIVKGDVPQPTPTPTGTPTPGSTVSPTPTAPAVDPDKDVVALPSTIAGTTPGQQTCTQPQR